MKTTYETPFRRRREDKTNYAKRLAFVKSGLPRIIFRISNRYVKMQITEFDVKGDKCLTSANSKELKKFGWENGKNTPSAYLTGYLLAKKSKNVEKAIFDIGLITPVRKSRAFSALKGVLDGGIKIPFGEKALPSEERLKGKHIEDFGQKKDIIKQFEKTKKEIDSKFSAKKVVK